MFTESENSSSFPFAELTFPGGSFVFANSEEEDLASDVQMKPHEAMTLSSTLFCLKVHYLMLHSFLTSDICCCTDPVTAFILQISKYGSVCSIVTIKFFFQTHVSFIFSS
ncbi:hypothetical protein GOODEAATRI_030835 [Goodea atripinnis]|uniref:Uncharacterized protein n=1 Tax=Goodea atripinnis TaxID=208336 RepID=A0ABV0N5M1_9TELE